MRASPSAGRLGCSATQILTGFWVNVHGVFKLSCLCFPLSERVRFCWSDRNIAQCGAYQGFVRLSLLFKQGCCPGLDQGFSMEWCRGQYPGQFVSQDGSLPELTKGVMDRNGKQKSSIRSLGGFGDPQQAASSHGPFSYIRQCPVHYRTRFLC